jgi:hypothetical protein
MFERATDFYNKNISPSGIQEAGREAAMTKTLAQFPGATVEQVINAPATSVLGKAYQDALPGMFATYAPITGVGLGALGAFGGFEAKPMQSGPITKQLMKPVTQRIAEQGTQRQVYSQGLPGVVYDQFGAPVYGQSTRLPTYDVPDYNSGGYGMPQGGINLPPIYVSPPGTIGSQRVEQPYNTSDMYPNLVPRRAADGGIIQKFDMGGFVSDFAKEIAPQLSPYSPEEQAAQKAARDAVAQQKALRRSQGSGQMYSNINAGLAALAPEANPMDPTDTQFGARSRLLGLAGIEKAYGPMLQNQRDAMNQQAAILSGRNIVPFNEQPFPMPRYTNAGRQGEAMGNALTPTIATRLMQTSMTPVGVPTSEFDRYGGYEKVKALYDAGGGGYGGPSSNFMNMGGIATLARGGYPRRTGQISGPGTEKSDSIPAMLSDGEFVMTAKAVRGAGKGSRRAGAKKMYALMHQLEKNSERG